MTVYYCDRCGAQLPKDVDPRSAEEYIGAAAGWVLENGVIMTMPGRLGEGIYSFSRKVLCRNCGVSLVKWFEVGTD